MKWLTQDAVLTCAHQSGIVQIFPHLQDLVTIEKRKVLVDNDPENKSIVGCPNIGATIKPCTHTLRVDAGYSGFLRIDGRRICLDTVTGLTDGTPPGIVKYTVRQPGQPFVAEV